MIYAENQNVKTTPYKPPEGQGHRFPGQYQKQAKVVEPSSPTQTSTPRETRPAPVTQPMLEINLNSSTESQVAPSLPAAERVTGERARVISPETIDTQTAPEQDAPRPPVSEWANPPETERLPVENSQQQAAPLQPPDASSFPERQGATLPGETLEEYEDELETLEGGPIPTDDIAVIPDLTPPGLTPEQASEYPDYYEDASDLRDAQPGPMADERADAPPHEAPLDSSGTILVQVFTARGSLPVVDARVTIIHGAVDNTTLVGISMTDRDGRTRPIEVPAPARALSEAPSTDGIIPFAVYDIRVEKEGYYTVNINDVQVFSEEQTLQGVDMTPLPEFNDGSSTEDFTVLPQNL